MMTHPKIKIVGSVAGVALGVALGWVSLEWFLRAVESDDVRLVAAGLGEKLWMQAKFAVLSALIGVSVVWGAVVGRRWNAMARIVVLGGVAVIVQFSAAAVQWMRIAAVAPDGTEDMPALIYFSNLGTEWIPLAAGAAVWIAVVPLLFAKKRDPLNHGSDISPSEAPADGEFNLSSERDPHSFEEK